MAELEMIPIYIMGKRYIVPNTLTIMGALEYAGYTLIRGVGCRPLSAAPALPSTARRAIPSCTSAWRAGRSSSRECT